MVLLVINFFLSSFSLSFSDSFCSDCFLCVRLSQSISILCVVMESSIAALHIFNKTWTIQVYSHSRRMFYVVAHISFVCRRHDLPLLQRGYWLCATEFNMHIIFCCCDHCVSSVRHIWYLLLVYLLIDIVIRETYLRTFEYINDSWRVTNHGSILMADAQRCEWNARHCKSVSDSSQIFHKNLSHKILHFSILFRADPPPLDRANARTTDCMKYGHSAVNNRCKIERIKCAANNVFDVEQHSSLMWPRVLHSAHRHRIVARNACTKCAGAQANINNKLKLTTWFVGLRWRLWNNISFVWLFFRARPVDCRIRFPHSECFVVYVRCRTVWIRRR